MTKKPDEIREDNWILTDAYFTAGAHLVASVFIVEEEEFIDEEAFKERAVYVMRQHAPIMYTYLHMHSGLEQLPAGVVQILLEIIRLERPGYMLGGGEKSSGIILPFNR